MIFDFWRSGLSIARNCSALERWNSGISSLSLRADLATPSRQSGILQPPQQRTRGAGEPSAARARLFLLGFLMCFLGKVLHFDFLL